VFCSSVFLWCFVFVVCVCPEPVHSLWSLHDIAIANIVWCMAFKGGVGGGACIAQWLCSSIAIRYALQMEGVNKRMVDSHAR